MLQATRFASNCIHRRKSMLSLKELVDLIWHGFRQKDFRCYLWWCTWHACTNNEGQCVWWTCGQRVNTINDNQFVNHEIWSKNVREPLKTELSEYYYQHCNALDFLLKIWSSRNSLSILWSINTSSLLLSSLLFRFLLHRDSCTEISYLLVSQRLWQLTCTAVI